MQVVSLKQKYINENLDFEALEQLQGSFTSIDAIIGPVENKLPTIKNAVEEAKQNANTIMGKQSGLAKRVLQKVTGAQNKAVLRVMEIQIQLGSLFKAIPAILTIAGKDLKKNLQTNVGSRRVVRAFERGTEKGEEKGGLTIENSVAEVLDDQAFINVKKLMIQALSPSEISKKWIDPESASDEILGLPVKEFQDLANRSKSSKVNVDKEDLEASKEEKEEEPDSTSGKAQKIVLDLIKGDKQKAQLMKAFMDELEGFSKQDLSTIKKGLEKFLQ